MKKHRDSSGFYFIYLDEVENEKDFELFLFGSTVPTTINNRKRAYWHDYLSWLQQVDK